MFKMWRDFCFWFFWSISDHKLKMETFKCQFKKNCNCQTGKKKRVCNVQQFFSYSAFLTLLSDSVVGCLYLSIQNFTLEPYCLFSKLSFTILLKSVLVSTFAQLIYLLMIHNKILIRKHDNCTGVPYLTLQ